jgi:hypothetical protein
MRSLLLGLILCISAFGGTWSTKDSAYLSGTGCNASSGTTCNLTISSTTAGWSAVVTIWTQTSGSLAGGAVTDNASGGSSTWVDAANVDNGSSGSVHMWYCLSLRAGATQVSVAVSNNSARAISYYAAGHSTATGAFDTSATTSLTGSATTHAGPTLTLTGSNDFIVHATQGLTQGASSIDSSYQVDASTSTTKRMAWLINTGSGTGPTWTYAGATTAVLAAVAIKEGAAASAVRHKVIVGD